MMKKVRVGVIGPGTIGHKVIWAIERQEDMVVSGVAKTSPDWVAKWVAEKGYKLYPSSKKGAEGVPDAMREFKEKIGGEHIGGPVEELFGVSDVIVDCTGSKFGARNKEELYVPYNKANDNRLKVLFQGGESADIGASFNTRASYDKCVESVEAGNPYLRVVSCNTTGLARLVGSVIEHGWGVDYLTSTLIRRSTDPGQSSKMRIDGTEVSLKIPSHHAPDLQEVLDVEAYSRAYKVPVSSMHVHDLRMTFKKKAPSKEEFASMFEDDVRVALLETFDSTIELRERVRRINKLEPHLFPGGDLFMSAVSTGSYYVFRGREVWLTQGIPQDSIVVPETIDCIRASMHSTLKAGRDDAMSRTDESLKLGLMKEVLEESYR
ncbi:MAG: type II glyceraldehyde-3-phosphate dehydrogenase [Candidatus Altiarchaeota archaeon]